MILICLFAFIPTVNAISINNVEIDVAIDAEGNAAIIENGQLMNKKMKSL